MSSFLNVMAIAVLTSLEAIFAGTTIQCYKKGQYGSCGIGIGICILVFLYLVKFVFVIA